MKPFTYHLPFPYHQYQEDKDGQVGKCAPGEAVSNEFIDVPDWAARHNGLKLAFKLRGDLVDRQVVETELNAEEAVIKIATILKKRGANWDIVCGHLTALGMELPADPPSWWEEI